MISAIKPTRLTIKKIEAEWFNYHHTLREIAKLREEIMNPYQEQDDNIGGGQSNISTRPTEIMATRLTTNKQLNYLTEIIDAIDSVYAALPDNYKRLVRLRYWSKHNKKDWAGIALELDRSERQAQRWRDEIMQTTLNILGWR